MEYKRNIHGNDRIAGIARVQSWDHSPSQDDKGGHWPAVRILPAGRAGGRVRYWYTAYPRGAK